MNVTDLNRPSSELHPGMFLDGETEFLKNFIHDSGVFHAETKLFNIHAMVENPNAVKMEILRKWMQYGMHTVHRFRIEVFNNRQLICAARCWISVALR
jgi:hypothetical protein